MLTLYPEIKPYADHRLQVDEVHELYMEECGNPDGIPVLVVHGGPGRAVRSITAVFLMRSFIASSFSISAVRSLDAARGTARKHHAAPGRRYGTVFGSCWALTAGCCLAAAGVRP